jgi:hypothetical protein
MTYDRYPKQKIIMVSRTGFLENIRNLLSTYELIKPNTIPINSELNPRDAKSCNIMNGLLMSIDLVVVANLSTVLNRMIDTASLIMPSPNMILNSLG